jgi:hypothetical protein
MATSKCIKDAESVEASVMIEMEQFLLVTVVGFVGGIGLFWTRLKVSADGATQSALKHAILRTIFATRGWRNVMAALTVISLVVACLSPSNVGNPLNEPGNPFYVGPSVWDPLEEWPWWTFFGLYLLLTIIFACIRSPKAIERRLD